MVAYKKPEDMTLDEMLSVLRRQKLQDDAAKFPEAHPSPGTFIDTLPLNAVARQTPLTAEELDALQRQLKDVAADDHTVMAYDRDPILEFDPDGGPRDGNDVHVFARPVAAHQNGEWARAIARGLQVPPEYTTTTSDYKEPVVGQGRIYVKDMTIRYNGPGMRYDGVGTRNAFASLPQVEVDLTLLLPDGGDPNELLNWLKDSYIGAPSPARPGHLDGADVGTLRHQMDVLGRRNKTLEEQLEQAQGEVAKLKKDKEQVEATLVQLRQRMNQAIQAVREPEVALDLYREVLAHWSNELAEGASFTAAEGEELATTLAEMLQYIDVAREVARRERVETTEEEPAQEAVPDQLF